MLRTAVLMLAGAAWLFALGRPSWAAGPETVTVHLSSFTFTPDQFHLHSGIAVVLHIVNDSSGGHNFSAPELFAASAFPGSLPPPEGKIELDRKQSVDVAFVPRTPGRYEVRCTHFLHSLFGMTATIIVDAPVR